MRLIEMIKRKIKSVLDINERPDNTIKLNNLSSFELDANISRVWSWSDREALEQMYKQLQGDTGLAFWAVIPSQGIMKRHTGIPGTILRTLNDLIISDMNDITVDAGKELQWKEIYPKLKMEELIKDAVKETFISGDGAFRIVAYEDRDEIPVIEFISGENIEYVYRHGRIIEIRFKEQIKTQNATYELEEIYGYGYIRNEIYLNGSKVDWGSVSLPGMDGMQEIIEHDKSYMMAVPLMFFRSAKHKGRGQGIFVGKFDSFDSLDEVWSQWMEALRKGRSKEYIPRDILPVNPNTGEYMQPNAFDNAFIALESSVGENARNEISLQQPSIPHESYLQTYITALDLCLQGIISPSTLGIDVKKMDNAEAQREKEKATLYTRNTVVTTLQEVIPELIDVYFKVLDELQGRSITDTKVEVTFGEYANPSFESQVETVTKAKSGGIMSIEASIDELYGDSKDDEWKKAEIERIKMEQGIAEMEEPALNMDGVEVEAEEEETEEKKTIGFKVD